MLKWRTEAEIAPRSPSGGCTAEHSAGFGGQSCRCRLTASPRCRPAVPAASTASCGVAGPSRSILCVAWSTAGNSGASPDGLRAVAWISHANPCPSKCSLAVRTGWHGLCIYSFWLHFRWRTLTLESTVSKLPFESGVIFSCFLLRATSAAEIGPWGFKAAAWLRKRCWIKAPCFATLPLLFCTPSCVSPAARKGSWPWSESKEERRREEERWS